jgi:hypothetical protein
VQLELIEAARTSILAWLEQRDGTRDDYLFRAGSITPPHLSTRQYARLHDEWVTGIGPRREDYGTHSLRRTKASIIYKATDIRPRPFDPIGTEWPRSVGTTPARRR